LQEWCDANDKRHRDTGWILVTQGDGDYGHRSIESMAQLVARRLPPVPVVFFQSDYGYAEPDTPYWPSYASAGLFGPGVYHHETKLDKEGRTKTDKDGEVERKEAWGGYAKDADGKPTGTLGYPDQVLVQTPFGTEKSMLKHHIGGIFVAGGGAITEEQTRIYQLRGAGRQGDYFCPATTLKGEPSVLNVLAKGYEEDAKAEVARGTGKRVVLE